MRNFSAHYIFPVSSPPIKNGIISVDDSGKILDIRKSDKDIDSIPSLEFYNGVIVPGFINAHCHTELSWMKGKIPTNTGLPDFINRINSLKTEKTDVIPGIIQADNEMHKNGIVAAGDISNNNSSFFVKKTSKIYYHTFIEVFGIDPSVANKRFQSGLELYSELKDYHLNGSVTPHASYSVSPPLFNLIKKQAENQNSILSIHFNESPDEKWYFKSRKGGLFDNFIKNGIIDNHIIHSEKDMSDTILPYLPERNKILLIHNTHSTSEDIQKCLSYFNDAYFVFCPGSNLFIENSLPDIQTFISETNRICLGTDSLASNKKLSILDEMKTIHANFPEISFNKLLEWATLNGAKALSVENKFGSIESGKIPGLIQIENFDFENYNLKTDSKVNVIC